MSNEGCKDCLFRQFDKNPGDMPESMVGVFEVLDAFTDSSPESPGDAAEAIVAMETPIFALSKAAI